MKLLRQPRFLAAFSLASTLLAACEVDPTSRASAACEANTAQIAVWDGRIQKVCGCGGTDGEFAAPNAALNCTFAVGKTLHILFHGPFLRHQLRSSGGSVMPDTPVFEPSGPITVRAHAFTPPAAGTYSFADAFDSTLFGDLVVTP